jgi:tetratricopeptide (TPR) repeat protein
MAGWIDQALWTLRGLIDAVPLQAATEYTIWDRITVSVTTPAGLTLVATVLAAFAVGIVLGLFVGRARRRTVDRQIVAFERQVPESGPAETPQESGPGAGLRRELESQGLSRREINQRVRAFTARLGQMREILETLAVADPNSEALIRPAETALLEGDLDGVAGLLDQARGHFAATGRTLTEKATKRCTAAVQAAELAGDLEMDRRNYDVAARLFGQGLGSLPEGVDRDRMRLTTKLATAEFRTGNPDRAAPLLEHVASETARIEGAEHPAVAKALSRLAAIRFALGETAAAEALYRRAVGIDSKALGDAHPWVANDINNLAQLLKRKGDLDGAEPLLRKALEIQEKSLGPGHRAVRKTARDHIEVLRALKRPQEANAALARLAASARRLAG